MLFCSVRASYLLHQLQLLPLDAIKILVCCLAPWQMVSAAASQVLAAQATILKSGSARTLTQAQHRTA